MFVRLTYFIHIVLQNKQQRCINFTTSVLLCSASARHWCKCKDDDSTKAKRLYVELQALIIRRLQVGKVYVRKAVVGTELQYEQTWFDILKNLLF